MLNEESLKAAAQFVHVSQELLLSMLGAVYQFERSIILERQREGIAKAKERGAYKGRPRTIDERKIQQLLQCGHSIRETAKQMKVSISTVQRYKTNYT